MNDPLAVQALGTQDFSDTLFFRKQFIVIPTHRVFEDVFFMLLVILTSAYDVIMKRFLPN